MRYLLLIGVILLFATYGYTAPSISFVTQNTPHGGSISITGTDFGTKSPAKPLMWDDGESGTVDTNPSTSTANDDSQVAYSEILPLPTDSNVSEPFKTRYRAINYDPVTQEVPGPHSYSMQYIAGGHEEVCCGPTEDVSLTVATPSTYAERWYMNFYYRIDPDWPTPCATPNHKITTFQSGTAAYTPVSSMWYHNFTAPFPCADSGYVEMQSQDTAGTTTGGMTTAPDTSPPWYKDSQVDGDNPLSDWVVITQEISNDLGYLYLSINHTMVWGGSGNTDFYTGSGSYDRGLAGIRSITVGGYAAYDNSLTGTALKWDDAMFRYFDDIYIDSTLSRVVLANNATYVSATIIEPQPPTAWSSTEITATVNMGSLTGDTVYAFVFDADGAVNATGYAVTVGGASRGFAAQGVTIQ